MKSRRHCLRLFFLQHVALERVSLTRHATDPQQYKPEKCRSSSAAPDVDFAELFA